MESNHLACIVYTFRVDANRIGSRHVYWIALKIDIQFTSNMHSIQCSWHGQNVSYVRFVLSYRCCFSSHRVPLAKVLYVTGASRPTTELKTCVSPSMLRFLSKCRKSVHTSTSTSALALVGWDFRQSQCWYSQVSTKLLTIWTHCINKSVILFILILQSWWWCDLHRHTYFIIVNNC